MSDDSGLLQENESVNPAYLLPQFAAASATVSGWDCSSATAKADLKNYGFLTTPLCGLAS